VTVIPPEVAGSHHEESHDATLELLDQRGAKGAGRGGPKLAFDTVQTCLLLHGHGAYTEEMPYAQRLRDVLGLQIGHGTAQIMKLIIARHKAGRLAVSP
jgi:alkylation response protein AidB-like acyl-CoA dehydrogenase